MRAPAKDAGTRECGPIPWNFPPFPGAGGFTTEWRRSALAWRRDALARCAATTLNPGEAATAGVMFDGSNVRFTFGIRCGADGPSGTNGEVTGAQLATAISGTRGNSNAVSTLDTPFANDPPSLADMEVMRAKVNEMILNGRRP